MKNEFLYKAPVAKVVFVKYEFSILKGSVIVDDDDPVAGGGTIGGNGDEPEE